MDAQSDARADELIEGPRGRRMLYELGSPGGVSPFEALREAVNWATYWQPPFEVDVELADGSHDAELRAVAQEVARMPEAEWLWHPIAPEQFAVGWFNRAPGTPGPHGHPGPLVEPAAPDPGAIGAQLAQWRRVVEADETQFAREQARNPPRDMSGPWWSLPHFTALRSTPALGSLGPPGPAGLHLDEDWMGWERARVWPVQARAGARVLEIAGPDDWAALCRSHPVEVTESRRVVWGWTTGRTGRWLLPDWTAVARDWDAVHVTGAGYLRTAGRAITVDADADAATVLAGWEPGTTVWLTDAVELAGPPVDWSHEGDVWAPAG